MKAFNTDKFFPTDESAIGPDDIRALTPEEIARDAANRMEFGRSIEATRAALVIEDREEAAKQADRKQRQAERDAKRAERDMAQDAKEQWHRDIAERKSRERVVEAKRLSGELSACLLALTPHELSLCPALVRSVKSDLELALESL